MRGANFYGAEFSPVGEVIFTGVVIGIIALFCYGIYKASKW